MGTKCVGLTGSTGALGKRISGLLFGQPGVYLSKFPGDLRSRADQKNWVVTQDLHTVVLSGAIVPVYEAEKSSKDTFEVNALSNLNLALAMWGHYEHAVRICFISSSHVYSPCEQPVSEESPTRPLGTYGKSKLMGERLLQAVSEDFGFDLLIMRVFSFFSEDQHASHLYPSLLRKLADHSDPSKALRLVGWNNVRDFSSADEIASTIVNLVLSQRTGVVNVASGVGTTIGDFASQIYGAPLLFRDEDAADPPSKLVADIKRLTEWTKS